MRLLSTSLLTAIVAATPGLAHAGFEKPELDRVGSPYLRVLSDQPAADRVPLKETRADIDVAGVIAHVKVTQVYQNEGTRPLEAIYVFPGSTRAAVFGMRMTVGTRTIVAKINEKNAARQIYEKAKAQGKTASLLEQERPNVFQMNVANILPGDLIKVELDYVELLVPESGVYELVYPTVVGPRYDGGSNSSAPNGGTPKGGEEWAQNPYLTKGSAEPFKTSISAKLRAGMPIQAVTSPSHKITPNYLAQDSVSMEIQEPNAGNRDFVLRYRLAGNAVESGVLLFPGQEESFFLMMMQPPKQVELADMPAREYIFILDVSGSMIGYPLNITKTLMRELFRGLRPQDRFNVMTFSGGNAVLSERSLPATAENLKHAMEVIDRQQGGGATEILPAMQRALSMPRTPGMSTSMIVATDGYVTVEKETFDTIAQNLGKANLFSFGIGSSVNRFIIEGMAHAGMGEPFVVLKPDQAEDVSTKLKRMIESPVLTDISVRYEGFEAYDVEPLSVPDLFAERPVVVFGKYRGQPRGRITVTGKGGRGTFQQSLNIDEGRASKGNEALKYLWARHKIMRLADQGHLTRDAGTQAEVTRLGLKYNLMTEYTSFVAVDETVRNQGGDSTTVNVPLPLPQGVENSATGNVYPAAPPASRMLRAAPGVMGAMGAGGLGSLGHGRGDALSADESERKAGKGYASPAKEPAPVAASPAEDVGGTKNKAEAKPTDKDRAKEDRAEPRVEVQASETRAGGLMAMVRMMAEKLAKETGTKLRLVLIIKLDASGKIISVSAKTTNPTEQAFVQKLAQKLKGGQVQGDGLGEAEVKVSIAIQ